MQKRPGINESYDQFTDENDPIALLKSETQLNQQVNGDVVQRVY